MTPQAMRKIEIEPGIEVLGASTGRIDEVLTPAALAFVADLARTFSRRIYDLLSARKDVQLAFDTGARPDFLQETAWIRDADWTVAPLPADLLDRRVEITGPVERKMIINALNSGARVFMADFEDSSAPSWDNVIEGQANLKDAVRGTITYTHPKTGKHYELREDPAVLMVRPRGLHLPERHLRVAGRPVPACLVDFGLYFFHNAQALIDKGSGPYFYLPKLENRMEARLWNDVFEHAQDALGIARGTIKATVLIETITAAFEMDEILYYLRQHSAGLNCGRWDYIFSFIKKFRLDPSAVMPDRGQVSMTQPFMRAYTQLCIRTCHRRGVHAMGGMAAQIPIKTDPVANQAALAKVQADKEREAKDGHDGTWVAHPGLVPLALKVFDSIMPGPNQISTRRDDVEVWAADLLEVPEGTHTEEGLRHNIRVGVQYLEAWLRGQGCVPLYHLMEDAATAEISRTQVWQWIRHGVFSRERFHEVLAEETSGFVNGKFNPAIQLFEDLCLADTFEEFLTLPAYDLLVVGEQSVRGGEALERTDIQE